MFDSLSERFSGLVKTLSGRGRISESNVRDAMANVRTALLEADVNYDVVDQFSRRVLDKAIGAEVLNSLEPGQQIIKIVYDELVELMGPSATGVQFVASPPTVIMMCGLQGSGKTTTCGKLALYLKGKGKNPLLVAADTQRPAAIEQLATLATQVEVPIYREDGTANPVPICRNAIEHARQTGRDVVILDTAGRLHIDAPLMEQLRQINATVRPHQIFLVIDAMVGQDAVNSARSFNEQLEIDGIIVTKFDSDTRGGAALSVRSVTGKPIKFMGVGEKLQMLEEFHPDRIAQRILGMGDVLSLVEKAQEHFDEKQAQKMQAKLANATFTLDDFLDQMRSVRKMGPLKQLLGMMPGMGSALKDLHLPEEELNKAEAIIQSMARKERQNPDMIEASHRRRIARGAGVQVDDVSRLVKGFASARDMVKKMSRMTMGDKAGLAKAMAGMTPEQYSAMSRMSAGPAREASRLSPQQKRKLRERRRRGQ